MPLRSQLYSNEEKLELVLSQLRSLRARLNGLAIQRGLFESLSLVIGTAAVIVLAALLLEPLKFLCAAAILGCVLVAGVFRTIRSAYRMGASPQRAAQVADERAGLKGRLATIVSIADAAPDRPHLWPYLLEDALSLRDEFTPVKIEPRRVSRSLYVLLVYCTLAALVVAFALMNRRVEKMAAKSSENQMEVDVNNLDVRPADPDLVPDAEITGDPAAMRKLAGKLAAAEQSQGEPNGALGKLMGDARDLASGIQDRLTGRKSSRPRIRLRVVDSGEQNPDWGQRSAPQNRPIRPGNGAGQFDREGNTAGNENMPRPDSDSGETVNRDPGATGAQIPDSAGAIGKPAANGDAKDQPAQADGDDSSGGGSSHGSGSDPQHLFGRADEPPLGAEGFEIMIEARPAEHGPKNASQSYLPPKVRAALNERQHSDEPIARSQVPDDDRVEIKRVFER